MQGVFVRQNCCKFVKVYQCAADDDLVGQMDSSVMLSYGTIRLAHQVRKQRASQMSRDQ
jgi:hypothetical protein